MYDFRSIDFWVIAGTGLALGLIVGWLLSLLVQRKNAGGKNVSQLRREMEDYRSEVNEHFSRTAELFKESTEKYRDLYDHLAGGAQQLADDLPDRAQLEFKSGNLLVKTDDDESPDEHKKELVDEKDDGIKVV
ncbi:MAG: DUF1043 family protein [Gammaproteobacteria bacterium]|nr:DUF1043 family protein [Gammaproteobacteria bacterium]